MKIIGIDLAGKEKNPTGYCVLVIEQEQEKIERNVLLHYDEEIINEIKKENPNIICIDSPLSFPKSGYFRESDIELKKRGFKPLSPLFPGMKPLVERGIRLKKIFEEIGYKVIEVFPRATEKILNIEKEKRVNKDLYDAFLCALTGKYYMKNQYEILGNEIVIPK
jgi:predicted nuclease with RNAse H fold